MSDAALAAVAGLLGVALSGGVQVGLEAWRDHKNRRAALRPVRGEITGLITLLRVTLDNPTHVVRLPQPEEWPTHQEVLSRELSERKWNNVVESYAMYNTVLTLWETFLDSDAPLQELMGTVRAALDLMNKAHDTLR